MLGATIPPLQGRQRFLEVSTWQTAWDRYALAAAALDQLQFKEAMMHKATVLEAVCAWRGGHAVAAVVARHLLCRSPPWRAPRDGDRYLESFMMMWFGACGSWRP